MPVAERLGSGLFALMDAASFVSGLRSISTAFPISIESLTGLRYASMRSKVEVPVFVVFVLPDVLVLVLMTLDTDDGFGDEEVG